MFAFIEKFLLGDLLTLKKDPLGIFRTSVAKRPVTTFRIGRTPGHLVGDPELTRHFLVQNQSNYDKRTRPWMNISLVIGNSLLVSNGSFWRRQRRMAAPAFHGERVHTLGPVFMRIARDCALRWDTASSTGTPLRLEEEMMRCALLSATRALFGADVDDSTFRMLSESVPDLLRALSARTSGLPWPMWMPTRANLNLQAAIRPVHRIISTIIEGKRASLAGGAPRNPGETDLLTTLMLARDETTGKTMTDTELRDEVMGFFFAGHETTAVALTWFWILLQRHPDELALIREELASELGSRVPADADLPKLGRIHRAVMETLRIYPPVWMIDRRALGNDQLGNQKVGKGDIVICTPYGMHRNAAYWKNPDDFDPSRFEPGWEKSANRFAFMPFGAGPRACIGMSFVMLEMQLLLAYLIPRFTFDVPDASEILPIARMTIRPDRPVWMSVRRTNVPL